MNNKLAFIVGGSEGIGLETAKLLGLKGYRLVIFSRSIEKLKKAHALIVQNGVAPQSVTYYSVDITDYDQTQAVMNSAIATNGEPGILINTAGYARPGYINDLGIEHFKKMMDLNYMGAVNVAKAIVPIFIKNKAGTIINTSSLAGFIGLFGYTGYCASKFALMGFSEALYRELEPYGIKVSVLCPPNTRTPGLEEENKYKPAEVLKTEEKAKPVDPDVIAKYLIQNLDNPPLVMVPTFDGKLAYKLKRFLPSILHHFVKRDSKAE